MWGYLMIAPVVIGLAVFYIYPFFDTLVNSFKTIGAFNVSKWCGLANYKKLTTDESLWHTLYNTFRYVIFTVPVTIILSLLLAVLLNTKNLKGHGTFLMRQFFMSLPKELEDAAKLDGCNYFQIFYKIMLPLVKPGLITLAIITVRLAWNDLMWPLVVNPSTDKTTLAAALANLQGQYSTDYPTMMAGSVMAILPLVIMFAVFQKQFIEGIAFTGTKA